MRALSFGTTLPESQILLETIRYPKCRPARNAIPRTVVKTPPSEELLLRSSPPRGKIALPHQHHSFCVLWLLPSPLLARMVLSSTVDCPQLMEVAHANLNQDTCPPQGGPQTFAVISLPKESSSPEPDSFDRVHTFPKAGDGGHILHPRNVIRWIKLVSPFVVALCPAPPVARKRVCHCLAADSPGPPAPTQTTLPH